MKLNLLSLIVFIVFVFSSLAQDSGGGKVPKVSPDQLVESPQKFFGRTVQAEGRIVRLFGKQSFTMESGGRDVDPDLLVLVPAAAQGITSNKRITVTGTLKPFDLEQFRREYEWFEETNVKFFKLIQSVGQAPALIASSIQDENGRTLWDEGRSDLGSTPNNSQATDESSAITSVIEKALQNIPGVDPNAISVASNHRTVMLTGSVPSLPVHDRILQTARKTKGVTVVEDHLKVEPTPRTDRQIGDDVVAAVTRDPVVDRYQIQISVSRAIVTLAGNVDSPQEKRLAGQLASEVIGVREVINKIAINTPEVRSDRELTSEVKNMLGADPYVDLEGINVSVRNGEVTLSGTVGSVFEFARASSAALITGIKTVNADDLRIEPGTLPVEDVKSDGKLTTRESKRLQEPSGARLPNSEQDRVGASALPEGQGERIQDALLNALKGDARIEEPLPTVRVKNGTVTLTGFVDNLRAKNASEERARMIAGVRAVNNELKVRPQQKLTNQLVGNWVKQALESHPELDHQPIRVRAQEGTIYLSGTLESPEQRKRAAQIASRVPGVTQIRNNLAISRNVLVPFSGDVVTSYGIPDKPTAELKEDIEEQLAWSPFVDAEEVNVIINNNGVVTLTGTVDTWRERDSAEENAFEGGAVMLFNKLEVRN